MDKEDMVYVCNRILVSHKKWNVVIYNNVDGARRYNVKWNKSVKNRQIPQDFTHMWNLRNKKKKNKHASKRETKANQETES